MKNKRISLILLCTFALAITGCNKEKNLQNEEQAAVAEMPEEIDETGFGITLEEQQICAEYAAGVLMKYNAGSNMRVLEGEKFAIMEAQEQKKKAQEEQRQKLAEEYQVNKKENSNKTDSEESSGDSKDSVTTINYIEDLSAATGTEAFSILYTGYEITDSYPENGEEALLAIDAVQGKDLLVVKFNVTNNSGQAEMLNLYSSEGKYKLNMDGSSYKAQQTLLLNDLSMYKEEIEAGATVENVLIFEIPEEKSNSIGNMELDITIGDEVNTMLLEGGSVVINSDDTYKNEDVSDLAEEYEAALLMEELDENTSDTDNSQENASGGNVTVVGSNNSVSQE